MKNRRWTRLMCAALGMAALLSLCALALGEEAQNITAQFTIAGKSKYRMDRLCDGSYLTKWISSEMPNPALTFASKGEKAYGLYVCFAQLPAKWGIQTRGAQGDWETIYQDEGAFLHTYVPLDGVDSFRLAVLTDQKESLSINELAVYAQGELPKDVQLWQKPPAKADLLVLVAHPDDELIMMGGTIPTYAVQKGHQVVVAYMTVSNTSRSSELLNGLWSMGYRTYPVLGGFSDRFSSTLKEAYAIWNQKDVRQFVMGLVRGYKPDVVVTHDINGEYGHGAHRVCADMAITCAKNGDNQAIEPKLYEALGGWTPKKLYLHLYKEQPIRLHWRIPLSKLGGQTALEAAQEAYKLHLTQRTTAFCVSDAGENDNAAFGLYSTSVGADINQDDFMENIPGKGEMTLTPPLRVAADAQATKTAPLPQSAAKSPAWSADWPPEAGERNSAGFKKEGEYVLMDEDKGLWFYACDNVIVRIDRCVEIKQRRKWYQAHIYVDLNSGQRVRSVQFTPDAPGKKRVQITRIARENQVVFGMNTDYYTYRVGASVVGVVVRDRLILHDTPPAANRSKFPNLDVLAMYEDGDWRVYHSDEFTAQQYLDMGAVNVYSFGPYLVRDGEMNPFIDRMYAGKTGQPRCALGMIEKGHYYAVLEEGRFSKTAKGTSIKELAENMLDNGCVQALNMDGGQTAVFTFMGEQIIHIAPYGENRSTLPRATSELIGVGFSSAIDPLR